MNTKKLLISAMVVLVVAMLLNGLYYPDSPLMWLAATSNEYAYMRAALIGVLVTLLITDPPRSKAFRVFLGVFASTLFVSTALLINAYTIGILDAVIFVELAIIFMIEALESEPTHETTGLRIKPLAYK